MKFLLYTVIKSKALRLYHVACRIKYINILKTNFDQNFTTALELSVADQFSILSNYINTLGTKLGVIEFCQLLLIYVILMAVNNTIPAVPKHNPGKRI